MFVEDIKQYIIQHVRYMDESDERFLKQLSTLIRKYQEEKRGL